MPKGLRAAQAVVGPVHLARAVAQVPAAADRQELPGLGEVEFLELRPGAAKPDLTFCGVDKIEGDQPGLAMPVDHQMGDRPGNRVDDYLGHLAAGPIGAAGVGPDGERRLGHGILPGFPGL
jgi:hypothetical protein